MKPKSFLGFETVFCCIGPSLRQGLCHTGSAVRRRFAVKQRLSEFRVWGLGFRV